MTDEQRKRIHNITYSCEDREELAMLIVHLEDENAKLIDVLHEVEEDAVHAYHCLRNDIERAMYSESHYFNKWWSSACEAYRLKAENAKLRKLAKDLLKNCLESPFWPRDTNLLRIRCRHMGIEVSE